MPKTPGCTFVSEKCVDSIVKRVKKELGTVPVVNASYNGQVIAYRVPNSKDSRSSSKMPKAVAVRSSRSDNTSKTSKTSANTSRSTSSSTSKSTSNSTTAAARKRRGASGLSSYTSSALAKKYGQNRSIMQILGNTARTLGTSVKRTGRAVATGAFLKLGDGYNAAGKYAARASTAATAARTAARTAATRTGKQLDAAQMRARLAARTAVHKGLTALDNKRTNLKLLGLDKNLNHTRARRDRLSVEAKRLSNEARTLRFKVNDKKKVSSGTRNPMHPRSNNTMGQHNLIFS